MSSDTVVVVTTMDALDMQGTRSMIEDLYEAFGKKTGILLNKVLLPYSVPSLSPMAEADRESLLKQLKETFGIPIFGVIPCYCDVLRTSRTVVLAFQNPEHPFTRDIDKFVEVLEEA